MSRSVERYTRRAFRAMVFWRIVGDLVALPSKLLFALIQFIGGLRDFVISIERSVFYFELEAARRYKALNGVDLAFALGETMRYAGLNAARAVKAQDALFTPGGDDEE